MLIVSTDLVSGTTQRTARSVRQAAGFAAIESEHRRMHEFASRLLLSSDRTGALCPADYDNFSNSVDRLRLQMQSLAAELEDAMSSHRPYRATLGIESALDEIRCGRKVEYDAAAVDACLKLFAEKQFRFSDS